MKAIDGKGIKNVPVIEFTEAGLAAIKQDKLVMLGGNHRRKALRLYIDSLKRELEDDKREANKRQGEIGPDMDELRQRIASTKDEIEKNQFWALKLYDISEW